jgi:hypothetical protein
MDLGFDFKCLPNGSGKRCVHQSMVQEMQVARKGLPKEVVTGRKAVSAQFDGSKFNLDYLTEPTGFMDLGFDLKKVNVASKVQNTDKAFVVAYPHFNVNGACNQRHCRLSMEVASVCDEASAWPAAELPRTYDPCIEFNQQSMHVHCHRSTPCPMSPIVIGARIYFQSRDISQPVSVLTSEYYKGLCFEYCEPPDTISTLPGAGQAWPKHSHA